MMKINPGYKVHATFFGQNFAKTLFKNKDFPVSAPVGPTVNYYRFVFDVSNPRIWDLETPWLYQVQVEIADKETGEKDIQSRQFGMRSFRFDESGEPKGMYYLNGRKIRLHGANTMGFERRM
jgi:beta-galactosidase/beta-glucuronidase